MTTPATPAAMTSLADFDLAVDDLLVDFDPVDAGALAALGAGVAMAAVTAVGALSLVGHAVRRAAA